MSLSLPLPLHTPGALFLVTRGAGIRGSGISSKNLCPRAQGSTPTFVNYHFPFLPQLWLKTRYQRSFGSGICCSLTKAFITLRCEVALTYDVATNTENPDVSSEGGERTAEEVA